MKNLIIAVAVSSILLSTAFSANAEYKIRAYSTEKLSTWQSMTPLYSMWSNTGGIYACTNWLPLASSIDYGSGFTQERNCKQDQQRNVQQRQMDSFSGIIKNTTQSVETRVNTIPQSQYTYGTKNVIVSYNYSEWVIKSTKIKSTPWNPAKTLSLYCPSSYFDQTREVTYSRLKERTVTPVYSDGSLGTQTIEQVPMSNYTDYQERRVYGTKSC